MNPNDYNLCQVIGTYMELVPNGDKWMKAKSHDSLVIDMEHNRFYWNSRGITWGTIFDFYMTYFNVDFDTALKMAKATGNSMSFARMVPEEKKSYQTVDLEVANIHHGRLTNDDYEWWGTRGVLSTTVDRLMLGTMLDMLGEKWYTIPILSPDCTTYDNYKLRRADDGTPRYRHYKPGLRPALYNPFPYRVKNANQVVIVAGEIKAMVLSQYGIPTVTSSTGVNTWQPEWAELFRGKEAIICFDPKEHLSNDNKPSSAGTVHNYLFSAGIEVREAPLPYDPDDAIVIHGMTPMDVASSLGLRRENIWMSSMDTLPLR